MATPTSQPSKPPSSTTMDDESRALLVHNVSIAALICCPIVMALPPRKFDFYTCLLLTGTFLGGNQLTWEYTGRSFLDRAKARVHAVQNLGGMELPEKAKIMQVRLREERERREKMQAGYVIPVVEKEEEGGVLEEVKRKQAADEKEEKERGLIEKVWLGGEGEDWKAKRDKREREALEEGRGYGDLIMEQIWEVWSWGKDKVEDVKEKDEEVVEERKEHKLDGRKK